MDLKSYQIVIFSWTICQFIFWRKYFRILWENKISLWSKVWDIWLKDIPIHRPKVPLLYVYALHQKDIPIHRPKVPLLYVYALHQKDIPIHRPKVIPAVCIRTASERYPHTSPKGDPCCIYYTHCILRSRRQRWGSQADCHRRPGGRYTSGGHRHTGTASGRHNQ